MTCRGILPRSRTRQRGTYLYPTHPPPPPLPMPYEPGVHRGSFLPFASDDKGNLITTKSGSPKLYMPEFLG